jgi:PTS system mannose-specific IID component
VTAPSDTRPGIPTRLGWRVFWRSLFIQAGFSPEALQTLGLLYALAPALEHLYPDEAARKAAVTRHLVPFNTHPYAAAAIVGGILHHEVRVARGEAAPEAVTRFKTTLMGPLAALGDGFFWLSWRPAVGVLSCALVPAVGAWAPVIFLVLYNVVHFWARAWLFWRGLSLGDGVVVRLQTAKVPLWSARLRLVSAALAGALGAWLALRFGALAGGELSPWLAVGCLAVGAATVLAASQRWSPYWLLYGLAGAAVAGGAFL